MANRDLIDALNDCIERLLAGESIEQCVQDYPQYAARLRQLLQTGELVHRAVIANEEVKSAQRDVRARVQRGLKDSQIERSRGMKQRGWLVPLLAVASLVLIVVVGLTLLGPATGNIFSNIVSALNREGSRTTSVAVVGTPTPESAALAASPTPFPLLGTPTQAFVIGASATFAPLGTVVPTSVYSLSPVPTLNPAEAVQLTATSLGQLLVPPSTTPQPTGTPAMTATPLPTMPPTTATLAATLGALPPTVGAGVPTQQVLALPTATAAALPEIIPLSAGEIDDNARWDNYLLYRKNYLQQYGAGSVHNVEVSGRQIITVSDAQGLPVLGARVSIYAGQTLVSQSETYATGKTLFFPNAQPVSPNIQSYRVVVEKDNAHTEFTLDPRRTSEWTITLTNAALTSQQTRLDVLFLLDATGSMGGEIAQLQNNLLHISEEIARLPGGIDVRYGLVVYRDRGDEFITRDYDFTPDVQQFQTILSSVVADGGGDMPESLNAALHDAIQKVSWRGEDTVKLVFLVADAPPHLYYANDYDYAQEMVVAAQHGIKIHPIASSGLPPDGEYIFRQIAEYTMGHFIFLTYQQGASGAPGESRSDLQVGTPANPQNQQQGDYTVERLDELVLRLIKDELAALHQKVAASSVGVPLAMQANGGGDTPSQNIPPGSAGGEANVLSRFSIFLLIGIVAASVLLGYSLRSGRPSSAPAPTPKRKNEELV